VSLINRVHHRTDARVIPSSVGRAGTGSDNMPNVRPDDCVVPEDASMLETIASVVPTPTPLWIQSEFKYYKYLSEFASFFILASCLSLHFLSSPCLFRLPYLFLPWYSSLKLFVFYL
jgi:hypothetical protein